MLRRFEQQFGVDLGTCNTLIYQEGKGIVLQEPSVVAICTNTGKVQAIGAEAYAMIGRTPNHVEIIYPLQGGVIANFEIASKMLKYFMGKIYRKNNWFQKFHVVVSVPCGITNVQQRAVEEMIIHKGAKKSLSLEEPLAAAMGAGLPVDEPVGSMVLDIGGGTSQVALISLGGIVLSMNLPFGGMSIDQAIIEHLKKKYKMIIGERTAEDIKKRIASAVKPEKEQQMDIRGRDLVKGLPATVSVTSVEIHEILNSFLLLIVDRIRQAMEQCPPELAGDVMERGILLCGGGALLTGLDRRLQMETGVPVHQAEDPMACTVLGIGRMITKSAS